MNRMILIACLSLLLLLGGCSREEKQPWVPLLEDTTFSYLADTTRQALDDLHAGTPEKAEHQLLALQHFFIPMTQVRQLVFDADRLAFNGRADQAGQKLEQAREILLKVGDADGEPLRAAVEELLVMLDGLQRTLRERPAEAPAGLAELGHKVNLMLTRGDLVLAGAKFGQS